MAKYNTLVESLSPAELKALQWKKLKYHLDYLYKNNGFYRRLWDSKGTHPDQITGPEKFRELVPIIRKTDLLNDQQENPPFGSRIGVKPVQLAGVYWTSGTSGIGQELYGHTTADTLYYGQTWTHGLYWQGVRRGHRFFNSFPGSVGQLAGPDSMVRGLMLLGANAFHIGTAPTEDKLRHMKRFSPEHLATVPAYLQRLTAACEEKGWLPREVFPELKSIVLATEAYSIPWAEHMEEIWGCRIHEMYGSTQQGGGVAFTCEVGSVKDSQYSQMHLLEHLSYIEILDPLTREPVKEGEEGEVILTAFSREASSLVRFATDDKTVYLPGGTCSCGRPFASFLAGNIARYDDMLKIKMVNVWPAAIEAVLFTYPEIAEYQGRVCFNEAGQEQAILTIEYKADVPAERRLALKPELETTIRSRVGVFMEIAEAQSMLPRFEFKVRRWTDERKLGRQRVFYTAN